MDTNHQKTGLVNWLILLGVALLSVALARYASSAAGLVGAVFLGLGFLVAALSRFQMRLEERERFEHLEFEELKKAKGDAALFTGAGADTFGARRSREQFERFFVPGLTVLLLLIQGGAAWWFWGWIRTAPTPAVDRTTITMALYALFALVLFLLGKYSAGLARLAGQRLLRPAAGYLMLGSLICFTLSIVEAAVWFGFAQADAIVARGLCVVLALVALESLVGLVFEIYRPRVRGQAARLLYESRLIGLLGQPGGLITTAAQALDYQFGFKVSETWFYRMLEQALSWIILLQLGVLSLSTLCVIVEPDEQVLLERFGSPVAGREVLGPGLHLKWPWPIDQVYRYPTRRIQSFVVGVIPDPELEKERTVLWTRPHYKEEFNLLVASREAAARTDASAGEKPVPANLLAASIPVHYQITNLVQWAYGHRDAGKLLEDIANREVIRYLVSVDFDTVMSSGRQEAGTVLRDRIQRQAQDRGLGVQIVYIGLQNIHPPIGNKQIPVAASFEAVIGSMQQKQTNILAAEAYAAERVPGAVAQARQLLNQASSDRVLKVASAEAASARFDQQLSTYRSAPSVYQQRVYLDTLARTIGPVRKYILAATNTTDVVLLNLEEKIRDDLASGVILPPDALPTAQKP